jgi:hypothetical protein
VDKTALADGDGELCIWLESGRPMWWKNLADQVGRVVDVSIDCLRNEIETKEKESAGLTSGVRYYDLPLPLYGL